MNFSSISTLATDRLREHPLQARLKIMSSLKLTIDFFRPFQSCRGESAKNKRKRQSNRSRCKGRGKELRTMMKVPTPVS